jgi:hypothetical protein
MTRLFPPSDRGELIESSLESAWGGEVDRDDIDPWDMTPKNIERMVELAERELLITDPDQIREQDYEDAFRKILNDGRLMREVVDG